MEQERSLGPPPDPNSLPPRSDVIPNDNEPVGTVGPAPTADNAGFGATHVMYPDLDPPLEASAWAGWPTEWATPNTNSMSGPWRSDLDIVWACLDLNSRIISDMPAWVQRGLVTISPQPEWVANPCRQVYSHWGEFIRQAWWSFQSVGEVFIVALTRYSDGFPRTFMVMNPMMVNAEIGPDGLRHYSIGGVDATDDILHIRYASWPGDAHGHGPLEVCGDRVLAARTLMRYASDLARNGGVPWAVLKSKYRISKEQATKLKSQWIESARSRLGAPAIVDSDVDLQVLQVPPKDMALAELQTHSEARVAIMLGTPAFLVSLPSGADAMTYTNVASIFDYHWRATLRTLGRYITRAISGWALPSGTDLELDPNAYIQPDASARANYYKTMVEIGAMTPAEVRKAERMSPMDSPPVEVSANEHANAAL